MTGPPGRHAFAAGAAAIGYAALAVLLTWPLALPAVDLGDPLKAPRRFGGTRTWRRSPRKGSAFTGTTGGQAFSAALENPRDVRLVFSVGSTVARFIRLRLEQADQRSPWFVTDAIVNGVSAQKPE